MKKTLLIVIMLMFGFFALLNWLDFGKIERSIFLPDSNYKPSISQGKGGYQSNCMKCHGKKLLGTTKGPSLLDDVYKSSHHADLSFYFGTLVIFLWATLNGIITSIALETYMLIRQKIQVSQAFKIAVGMSLISMVAMEIAMNLTDYLITGGAMFVWWVVPIALFFGFITPWPYNYWRLKKLGKACH